MVTNVFVKRQACKCSRPSSWNKRGGPTAYQTKNEIHKSIVHTLVDMQGALLHLCEDHIDLQESFPSTATCYNFSPCSPLFMTHSYYLLEMVRCGKHPTPLAPDYHLRFITSCLIYPHHLSLSHYCLSWQTAKQSTIHDSIHLGWSSTARNKLQPEMIPILSLSFSWTILPKGLCSYVCKL